MARAVQKVWVAEGDVRRPRLDLLASARERDGPRKDEEAPAVDGRDRAVPAEMLAAAGRLDGARELEPAVLVDVRVLLQRRELRPARHGEVELREDGAGGGGQAPLLGTKLARGPPPAPPLTARALEVPGELHEGFIGFAPQDGVGDAGQEVLGVEGRAE